VGEFHAKESKERKDFFHAKVSRKARKGAKENNCATSCLRAFVVQIRRHRRTFASLRETNMLPGETK